MSFSSIEQCAIQQDQKEASVEQQFNDVEVSLEYVNDCVNELEHAVAAIKGVVKAIEERGVETMPMPHPFNFPASKKRIEGSLYNRPKILISAGCERQVDPCEFIEQIITLLLSLCNGIKRTKERNHL